jgi:hypothetical protein
MAVSVNDLLTEGPLDISRANETTRETSATAANAQVSAFLISWRVRNAV